MPYFEVHGYGRDTGRKRKRAYVAESEEDAREQASADGTVTESITRLPDPPPAEVPRRFEHQPALEQEPATERQKAYARSLGIDFAPDIGIADMSKLIEDAVNADLDVLQIIRKLAAKHRTAQITYWKYGVAEATTRIIEPYE